MKITIMCGSDVHDKTLVNRIGIDRGAPETLTVKNTERGRYQLFQHLKTLAQRHRAARIVMAYEASTLGFTLYDDATAVGIECYVLAPTKIRKSQSDKKKKRDKRDAKLVFETLRAHVLGGNDLPAIWIPDDETRDDREIVRARLDVGTKLTALKAQVQTLLKRNGVTKDRDVGTTWSKKYRHWLWSLELKRGAQIALASLLRQIESMDQEITILDKAIEDLSQTRRYEKPCQVVTERIKGVGVLTAMVYLTEMGDLSRFKNRRQVGSFLGLVPTSHETGDGEDRKGHITHEGPSRVRWVLCQAAWSWIRWDDREYRVYRRIAHRNPKHKKKAIVAAMRRLGILMWHVGLKAQQDAEVFQNAA